MKQKLMKLILTVLLLINIYSAKSQINFVQQIKIGQTAEQVKELVEWSTNHHNEPDSYGNTSNSVWTWDVKYNNGQITEVISCCQNQLLIDFEIFANYCIYYKMNNNELTSIVTQYENISIEQLKSNYTKKYNKIGEIYFSDNYEDYCEIYLAINNLATISLRKTASSEFATLMSQTKNTDDKITPKLLAKITDVDGNSYNTVQIGTQIWMAENLKTTKYRDNTAIHLVTNNTTWGKLTTPAYCWYNNLTVNKNKYGALYNWYTVNTKKLCPTGWHVPADTELVTLTVYLGHESTNETNFKALPNGARSGYSGVFNDIGDAGYWWTSSELDNSAWVRYIYSNFSELKRRYFIKSSGFSVRCLKN